ncbi:MAG: thiamine pyrophosphate-dependent enzyme, partial [Chlorobiales bacterium]|nr:thiamine pyrophosphate-dependent enzyme [Chlorobiales bacterium]
MNVQELATAVQYNIPATIIVWEDGGYGLIKWKQLNRFGKYSHTDFKNPDLVKLAQSFGCSATRVEAARDLIPALQAGFSEKRRPTVIAVPVDYGENMKLTEKLGRIISH